MITKEKVEKLQKKHQEAKKDFKNRCFMVIEVLLGGDIVYDNTETLKNDIYKIAHVGSGTCDNEHSDWIKMVEDLFKSFEQAGFI